MAETTQTEEQVSLKLLVNKESNKVIFAEAGKEFVDVLCSFLTLPLGTIARLVQKKDSNMEPVTVGCLNSLYQSVADLNDGCLWEETCKEMLLQPTNSSEDYCSTLKLNIDDTEPTQYFICSGSRHGSCSSRNLSTSTDKKCNYCGYHFTRSVSLKHFCNGFVNGVATFVITDDLNVLPNSVGNLSFSLLQNSGIVSTSSVEEMTVTITKEKVLDLLKCALLSKSALTDVFLGNKPSSRIFFYYDYYNYDVVKSSNIQITLNLVIRKSDGKVLFAHGEEDFADLLLSFLTFPLGAVVRKLGGNSFLDSIDGLYKSIADLDENKYLMSKEAKNRLVDPHLELDPQFKISNMILPTHEPHSFYCHFPCGNYDYPSTTHEQYKNSIVRDDFFINHEYKSTHGYKCESMHLVNPDSSIESHGGYVKGPRMYVATDDLVVAMASPISALFLLNRLETSLNDLEEKVVTIGFEECLRILKASLTSNSALTNGLRHLLSEIKKEK